MNMNIDREAENKPQSYFALSEHFGSILAHIILEVISWCFILPIAVMLSIAHSRYTIPVQFVFLIINAIALLFGIVYNTSTPDLYENNTHHKVGWITTWVMCAQVVISLVYAYSGRGRSTSRPDYARVHVSTRNMTDHHRLYSPISEYRWSGDSGQGTVCPMAAEEEHFPKPDNEEEEEDIKMSTPLVRGLFRNRALDKFFASRMPSLVSNRALRVVRIVYNVIDRVILPFGFITLATGIVTYSGIFKGSEIFSGPAHFIKGGIFFWYGLVSLGRYMGCWANFGWSWNLKPASSRAVTGEFVESALIFTYGPTHVFLEHLVGWQRRGLLRIWNMLRPPPRIKPSPKLGETEHYGEEQRHKAIHVGSGPRLTSDWPATPPHRIDQGVGSGSRVPVFQQAAADWVCSMLAIMRVGAIYVPLDLRNPLPRLALVVKNCEPTAILVDATTLHDVPQLGVDGAHLIDVTTVGPKASTSIINTAQADSPAAILYTSGSTGTPKGIVVTHAGLRNEIEGYTKMWKLGAERTLQQSAFTFNHSSDHGDQLRLASKWRAAFGGGESLTTTVTNEFAKLDLPNLRFYNSYGPTEISISSTTMEIAYREKQELESMGRIPCGYSLPNFNTYIVDEELGPFPIGAPGEICLRGAGVSLGYVKNPELTEKRFVPNPFATPEDTANGWTCMYRTGDIAHLREDGAMVFHSRIVGDSQVKIRGLRIELSDIESNIVTAAGGTINEAIVTLRDGDPEFLVAHVVFAPNHGVDDKEAFLERLLSNLDVPQYMIPVVAIPLDKFPLSNHSKVDRKAIKELPLPKRAQRVQKEDVELTETMLQLRGVWRELLGKSIKDLRLEIGPSTSFFFVGGNSLLIIRLQSQIRVTFNIALPLIDLLSANTLSEMAHKIDESVSVAPLDWEAETTPPIISSFLNEVSKTRAAAQEKKTGKTVVITGSTGFLAKHVIPQLAARPDVGTIHCIAVRDPAKLNFASPKIRCHAGDLSAPLLGLSTEDFVDLASQVDVILHLGAARSFWDDYNVLRPSNVHPTKELVKLATPGEVPIHFTSTAAVFGGDAIGTVSAADSVPALGGMDGYTATKWASERILERADATLGIPSTIYRFCPVTTHEPAPKELLDMFAHFVDMTKALPDATGWAGRMDMIPAANVASWLCESTFGNVTNNGVNFTHYPGKVSVSADELMPYLEGQMSGRDDLTRIPLLKWTGVIKRAGFEYFMMSHEASTGIKKGAKLEMRR
ncbi:hypothetical protein ZTR_08028 [Talaromyces verruculosus]|nr:hypothetical protein ZTR_08028 [Talaromyces verruculosus]